MTLLNKILFILILLTVGENAWAINCKAIVEAVSWRFFPELHWKKTHAALVRKRMAGDFFWKEMEPFLNSGGWIEAKTVLETANFFEKFIRAELRKPHNFEGSERSKQLLFQIVLEIRDDIYKAFEQTADRAFVQADVVMKRVQDLLDQPIEKVLILLEESSRKGEALSRHRWIESVAVSLKLNIDASELNANRAERVFRFLFSNELSAQYFRSKWRLDSAPSLESIVNDIYGPDFEASGDWSNLGEALLKRLIQTRTGGGGIGSRMAAEFLERYSR